MQQRPPQQTPSHGDSGIPPNFTPPPVPSFPYNGITPPHPHPVAPFPPPPHSLGAFNPGPISPPPLPHHSRPFYTLAMTHRPPHVHPRPRPHSSLFPHSSPPQFPTPPSASPTAPSSPDLRPRSPIRPRQLPLQPVPLRFPYPTTIAITCSHCGNHLLVDLSAHHLTNCRVPHPPPPPPPPRPPLAPPGHSGPVFWRFPLVRAPSSLTPPTQTSVSTSSTFHTSQSSHLTSLSRPPLPLRDGRREEGAAKLRKSSNTSKNTTSSKSKRGVAGKSVSSHHMTRIIPYRERRRVVTVETQARQQLQLEFSNLEKPPTVLKMGEIAGRLGVSRDFVRQWFASRRQQQQQRPSSSEDTRERTIPSNTHEITVEVPPHSNVFLENGVETVVVRN